MSGNEGPYRMCGCIYADTEEEARLLQRLVRALSAKTGGFTIEFVEKHDDGSETRRQLK